jgi:hypothetical protein
MFRLFRARSLLVPIAALALAVLFAALGARPARAQGTPQQSQAPATTPPGATQTPAAPAVAPPTVEPSTAYGPGGTRETDHNADGSVSGTREYDSDHHVRESTEYEYYPGTKQVKRKRRGYFSPEGHVQILVEEKWAADGTQTDYENRKYSDGGALKSGAKEHFDDPKTDTGGSRQTWDPVEGTWVDVPKPASPTSAPPPATVVAATSAPVSVQLGVIVPRDYRPGETISGSIMPAKIANEYSGVPGFAVKTFAVLVPANTVELAHYNDLEIGVKYDGFGPVNDGHFTVQAPMDVKGGLQLWARDDDVPHGIPVTYTEVTIDPPVAAPALPQNLVPSNFAGFRQRMSTAHLIELWNEAYNLELELADAEESGASDEEWGAIDEDLGECYDDIDYLTAHLPTEVVVRLAHDMADETRAINEVLRKDRLTDDQESELKEYDGWANFLDDEADEASHVKLGALLRPDSPFWTSPVLSQGRLGALRGPFSGDDCDSDVRLDGLRLSPIAETPGSFYFMPPDGLATGLHNYQIAGLGIPQSTLPVFYLTLQMWADQTNLHKGQSTTYHLKLSGLNGLPSSAWGSSFFPSDLVSPSELQGGSPDAIRTGTITLTITNESPGVISMKNVFATLNAQSFAPSGSFQFDGGVGAILDGGFSILGVSRAYLQPEWSWGSTPGSTLPISSDQPGSQAPASSGTTSMASAPAAPDCDLSDPPPAVLLPVNDLYVNSCMGPDTTRIFDGAMAASGESNSAYIGNPPAKPTVEEAQKRVADAEQAVKDWTKRETDATIKADKAWAAGLKNVPQGFIDDLRESREQGWDAQEKEDSASQAYDKDPSAENKAKLDDAEKQTAFTREHVESAMNAIEERFTPAQRAAYEAANGERKSARYYRARAEDDLEDARNALSQFPLQQSLKYLF